MLYMTLFFRLILFPCLQLAPTSKSHFLLTLENFLVYAFCLQFYFPLNQTCNSKIRANSSVRNRPQLFKSWIAQSIGRIFIHWTVQLLSLILIHRIVIYLISLSIFWATGASNVSGQ